MTTSRRLIVPALPIVLATSLSLAGDEFRVEIRCDKPSFDVKPLSGAALTIAVTGNQDWLGTVSVLDTDGYRVALPYVNPEEVHEAGRVYEYTWDGADDRGIILPQGEYVVRVEAVAVYPKHDWGGKWYNDHWGGILFDSRGDEFFYVAVNSCEQPATDFEFPECYGRFFDFDGLPMSDQAPLIIKNWTWGSVRPALDIKRFLYTPTDDWHGAGIDLGACKINAMTGERVWNTPCIVDLKTGEPFLPDGSCRREGRFMHWNSKFHLWDTSAILCCSGFQRVFDSEGRALSYLLDAGTGRLIQEEFPVLDEEDDARLRGGQAGWGWSARVDQKRDRFMTYVVRQFADGGRILTNTRGSPLLRYDKHGTLLYILEHHDRDGNGSLYDGPTRENRWGEDLLNGVEATPLDVDAAGNFYCGRDITKYNDKGQLILHCRLGVRLPQPQTETGIEVTVRHDGRLLGLNDKSPAQHPCFYELARDRVEVRVNSTLPPNPALREPAPVPEPETAADCLNHGRALTCENRDAEAVGYFLKVADLTRDPDYRAVALNTAGKALERLDRPAEAVAAYEKLAEIPTDASRGLLHAARCWEEQDRLGKAEEALNEALRKAPNKYWRAKSLLEQGRFYERHGQHEQALGRYDQVVAGDSHAVPQGLLGRARCLLAIEKAEQALAACRRIAEHHPIWCQQLTGLKCNVVKDPLDEPDYHKHPYRPRECQRLVAACEETLGRKLNTRPEVTPVHGQQGDLFADMVLGQKDLTSFEYTQNIRGTDRCTKYMVHYPQGLYLDEHGLYICDSGGIMECITIFRNPAAGNYQPVDKRFRGEGQYVMARIGDRLSYCDRKALQAVKNFKLDALYGFKPVSLTSDGTNYYIVDNTRHRVLVFEDIYREDASGKATCVLGQKDFLLTVRNNGGLNAASLSEPYGIGTDGRRLYLADRGNNRVLIWRLPIRENYQKADLVLGQADFGANGRNAGGVSASSLNRPSWVYSDGRRLVVSDCGNNRVLVWTRMPERTGAPADLVLGANDFSEAVPFNMLDTGYVSRSSFAFPMGIWIDGDALYVCDMWNNRVMIWEAFPTRNNQPADRILGQPSMEGIDGPYYRDDWYYALVDFRFGNQTTIGYPVGVCTDRDHIYVSDFRRQRILVYWK